MPRKWISPEEHEQLLRDPAFLEMREEKEAVRAKLVEQRAKDILPLLDDLSAVGVVFDRPSRLAEAKDLDSKIYPVLLNHLTKPHPAWLLEFIGRAFGKKSARPIVWDDLVRLVKADCLEKPAMYGVMVALSDMARPRDLPTLIELLSDQAIGRGRIFLITNLARSKKREARSALLQNRDDPELAQEIEACLARKPT